MKFKESKEQIKQFIEQGTDKRQYPKDKISDDDQGQLTFGLGVNRKTKCIEIYFNKEVTWLGFDLESARKFLTTFTKLLNELKDFEKKQS